MIHLPFTVPPPGTAANFTLKLLLAFGTGLALAALL